MGNLQFIGTGSKLATIPKTAGGFHCHNIYGACNNANDPSGNVVDAFKAHKFDLVSVDNCLPVGRVIGRQI